MTTACLVAVTIPYSHPARAGQILVQNSTTSRPAASKTYPANSLIIPMDIDYQDSAAFLASGLVYKLLSSGVPVDWIIKGDKRLSNIAPTGGAVDSGGVGTFTTTNPHNLAVNDIVFIAGVNVSGYNGMRTVASVPSPTQFTAMVNNGLVPGGNGLVMPSDFTASATDFITGVTITNHPYRGGPFVIDQANRATADPIVRSEERRV